MADTKLLRARTEILAHRRRTTALVRRSGFGPSALRRAATVGLADSVPRAAVLSIRARVADTPVDVLDDPALVQVRGPRSTQTWSPPPIAHRSRSVGSRSRAPGARVGVEVRRRVEEIAATLPLPVDGDIQVRWETDRRRSGFPQPTTRTGTGHPGAMAA